MLVCIVRDPDGTELGRFEPIGKRNLLSEALAAGVAIPHSCRVGVCANCACRITAGAEFIRRSAFGAEAMVIDDATLLTCVAGVQPEAIASAEEHVIELTTVL